MRFDPISIEGAGVVSIERIEDDRGFFARVFCENEFEAFGLPTRFVQSSLSMNRRRGTLRGMHFQWPPSREAKLVRCLRGSLHDVLLDLRPGSASYLKHEAVVLDAETRASVWVPAGVAHGFQTLEDDTEIVYRMTDFYAPDLSGGVRWNDPAFGIRWPLRAATISDRDRDYPDFDRQGFEDELSRHERGSR